MLNKLESKASHSRSLNPLNSQAVFSTVIVAYLLHWQNSCILKYLLQFLSKNLTFKKKFFNQNFIQDIFYLGVKIKKLNFPKVKF